MVTLVGRRAAAELQAGECLGLIGDNAAGKSTLTKVLAGTVIPDAGEIRLDGKSLSFGGPGAAQCLGIELVYQDLSLCDSVDVAGNLFLGREITRRGLLDEDAMRLQARDMLDRLGIRIPRHRTPSRCPRAHRARRRPQHRHGRRLLP